MRASVWEDIFQDSWRPAAVRVPPGLTLNTFIRPAHPFRLRKPGLDLRARTWMRRRPPSRRASRPTRRGIMTQAASGVEQEEQRGFNKNHVYVDLHHLRHSSFAGPAVLAAPNVAGDLRRLRSRMRR